MALREFKRVLSRWMLLIVVVLSAFSMLMFYQNNKESTISSTTVGKITINTKIAYQYYNAMLADYRKYSSEMADVDAVVLARMRISTIRNLEQWDELKTSNIEEYNAKRYESRVDNIKLNRSAIYEEYESIKNNNPELLSQYIGDSDEIDYACTLYDSAIKYAQDYKTSIDTGIEQGNSMLKTDVFSEKNSFGYMNVLKTKHDYRALSNVAVAPDNSNALESVLDSSYLNILLLMLVVACVFKFFDERKKGLWQII